MFTPTDIPSSDNDKSTCNSYDDSTTSNSSLPPMSSMVMMSMMNSHNLDLSNHNNNNNSALFSSSCSNTPLLLPRSTTTDSLFQMASSLLLDLEPTPLPTDPILFTNNDNDAAPAFHPLDEYKDMSLNELLDLSSDDYCLLPDSDLAVPDTAPLSSSPTTDKVTMMLPPSNTNTSPHKTNHPKKRKRHNDHEASPVVLNGQGRFRSYQADQWAERFQDLVDYKARFGHCLVPHTFAENLPLARWVKRQRYQYKLWCQRVDVDVDVDAPQQNSTANNNNSTSTMTAERLRALEEIGFCWDSQSAAWGERLTELRAFCAAHGHANVPSHYPAHPRLATWVKCQRRQYKLYVQGQPSNMTPARIEQLEAVGFEWLLRSYKKAKKDHN